MYKPITSVSTLPFDMPLPLNARTKVYTTTCSACSSRGRGIDLRSLHALSIYGAQKPLKKSAERIARRWADLDRCDWIIREHLQGVTVLELFKFLQLGVKLEGRLKGGGGGTSKKQRKTRSGPVEKSQRVKAIVRTLHGVPFLGEIK